MRRPSCRRWRRAGDRAAPPAPGLRAGVPASELVDLEPRSIAPSPSEPLISAPKTVSSPTILVSSDRSEPTRSTAHNGVVAGAQRWVPSAVGGVKDLMSRGGGMGGPRPLHGRIASQMSPAARWGESGPAADLLPSRTVDPSFALVLLLRPWRGPDGPEQRLPLAD
jgi:hypothetical protein